MLKVTDGAEIKSWHAREADIIVIGSGPAGATVARFLARAGAKVIVVEEGPYLAPEHYPRDGAMALALAYRDMGMSIAMGPAPIPYLQGRMVGGSSVINGAISWRLPRDVYQSWVEADPGLADAITWSDILRVTTTIERDLGIQPTDGLIAGAKNLLMAKGAAALGLEHRPINRNVQGCEGLGRCLQGCPNGHKQSMDRTFLMEAVNRDAEIMSNVRAESILVERGRTTGVSARAKGGGTVQLKARKAVVVACSAIQSPLLLMRSRIRGGPVGKHLQAHPGVSVAARFREEVRMWEGATQGHEVTGLRKEGIKLEVLGYDLGLMAMRQKGVGTELAGAIEDMAHWVHWGAAIKAAARGIVRPFGRSGTSVRYALTQEDMRLVRRGVAVLSQVMLAAGAEKIAPGVHGAPPEFRSYRDLQTFMKQGPVDPRSYTMAMTHLFGTCRMGSDPDQSVVGTDFRHHGVPGLYVADSSVFPTNTGVNPQTSIIVMATLCAEGIARALG